MTPPNEPGAPSEGTSADGQGSPEGAREYRTTQPLAGRIPGRGEPLRPPSPRGGPLVPPRREGPLTEVLRKVAPADAEARLNRFLTGTAAPTPGAPASPELQAIEPYASELPDLSGPIPRVPERAATPERGEAPGAPESARPAVVEAHEVREGRIQVGRRRRGPVRATMQIRRIDPWSTLKVSLLLSVALFFVWMIAVAFLYLVLGGMGVWAKLNSNVGDLLNNTSGGAAELVSAGTIFGAAFLVGLINIVLLTTLATIAAFVYNLATDVIGGIEVTLADRD